MTTVQILGCGANAGVPVIGQGWGKCDPANPKNHRTRSSICVSSATTRVLIDAGPDLRAQLLRADIQHLDAVVYTHAHADHMMGTHELAFLSRGMGKSIPVYADARTMADLEQTFHFAFFSREGGNPFHRPYLTRHLVTDPFCIGDLSFIPFKQHHGFSESLGFRIGPIAYSTDVVDLDDAAFDTLQGISVWIVDCLKETENVTHAHLEKTRQWIERVGAPRNILTHLSFEMDYDQITQKLPSHIEVAYDGLTFSVSAEIG